MGLSKERRGIFVQALWLEQMGRCCYCGVQMIPRGRRLRDQRPTNNPLDTTLEHITPQAAGGKHEYQNLALSCQRCNHKRADKAFIGPLFAPHLKGTEP